MQLPQIRLQSQMAQISIKQYQGKQEIRQPQADMSIQQPKAEITMKTTPSKLRIDQTEAWEDMNMMHISKRIEKFANDGYRGWLDGIEKRVRQGAELMKIEDKGNPIGSQAVENGFDGMKTLGIEFIPSQFAVNIQYEPAKLQIDTKVNKPIMEATPKRPEHRYERGTVDIGMRQYNDLDIDFVNLFSESV